MAEAIARVIYLSHQAGIAVTLGSCGAMRIPEFRLQERVAAVLRHQFGVSDRDATELTT